MKALKISLWATAGVQLGFGLAFVLAPRAAAHALGLSPVEPGWADWLFVMMGVRFLGYAVGLAVATRDPHRHELWITTMIAVQVVDWVATLAHLAAHHVTFAHVATAVIFPVLIVAAFVRWHPRRLARSAAALSNSRQQGQEQASKMASTPVGRR